MTNSFRLFKPKDYYNNFKIVYLKIWVHQPSYKKGKRPSNDKREGGGGGGEGGSGEGGGGEGEAVSARLLLPR